MKALGRAPQWGLFRGREWRRGSPPRSVSSYRLNESLQLSRRDLTFPDGELAPRRCAQGEAGSPVPGHVCFDLRSPEGSTGLRPLRSCAAVMMPEAPMHHHDSAITGEHDVRRTRQVFPVEPEAQSFPMKRAAHKKLRLRVLRPDSSHHAAANSGNPSSRQPHPPTRVPPDQGWSPPWGSPRDEGCGEP